MRSRKLHLVPPFGTPTSPSAGNGSTHHRAATPTGVWGDLARALLGMVFKAAPAKGDGAVVVFDREPDGRPIVAAHDECRCHVGYFPLDAAIDFRGVVERASVRKLYRLLGGVEELEECTVSIDDEGLVAVDRPGQAPLHHHLALVAGRMTDWRPPPDDGAVAPLAPLAVSTKHLVDAARIKAAGLDTAVVAVESRTSARVVVNVSVADDLVFRAIIAESGLKLYDRQGALPGVRR